MIPAEPEQGNACEGRCNTLYHYLSLQDVQVGFNQKSNYDTQICFSSVLFFTFINAHAQNEDSLKRAALFLEPVEVKAIRATENSPFAKINYYQQGRN